MYFLIPLSNVDLQVKVFDFRVTLLVFATAAAAHTGSTSLFNEPSTSMSSGPPQPIFSACDPVLLTPDSSAHP